MRASPRSRRCGRGRSRYARCSSSSTSSRTTSSTTPRRTAEARSRASFAAIVNDPNLRVHVLLSIREDALAKLDRFKGSIPRLFANYVRVEHLSREAARDAIEGPLREWNSRLPSSEPPYELGPGLVERVIDATATGGVTLVGNGGGTDARDA